MSPMSAPVHDPTPIFEFFRGSYGSELLTAAVDHFGLFDLLANGPRSEEELRVQLALEPRAYIVLVTALKAMKLLEPVGSQEIQLSAMAREHLIPGRPFYVGDYLGLAANSPGVVEMVSRLRSNRPAHADESDVGAAFIFRDGLESAMEREASARQLTLALAGRAKNVAPVLAGRLSFEDETLLDIGGGTGIYSIACLQRHSRLKAIVFDRPEVLKVAQEFAATCGVADRLKCVSGDMFSDAFPASDAILLSNVLHDWDIGDCQRLVNRCVAALNPGGRLLVHDVFLNDNLDGPLPIAFYSASLFSLTEGRAYSAGEYRSWLNTAGLTTSEVVPTLIHCGILTGVKRDS